MENDWLHLSQKYFFRFFIILLIIVLIGIVIIVSSGIYVFLRENVRKTPISTEKPLR